jgi:DNA-binding transcriptional LysR family regulator
MEIRVLKYFLAVAREGNITKAADVLHITQPTLSRQLMQLEEELGTPLLIRGKRKIVLTESGMLLKRRAEEIISLSKKTELEISHQSDEVKGEITLACGLTEATNTMARYIKAFNTLYPDVTFKIKSGNADYIIEEIQNGLVDIGFVLEPVNLDKLDFLKLNEIETWGLLMRKDHPLAKKQYITANDLIGIPLINTGRVGTQDEIKKWMGNDYTKLHFTTSVELLTTASILVENEIGSALVIEGSAERVLNDDLCLLPLYPSLHTHSLVVWKKYQSFTIAISKFIQFITMEIQKDR